MPSWTMKNDSGAVGASVFKFTTSDYPFELGVREYSKYKMIQFSTPAGVSGADAEAVQFWLKSGMLWYYAFNHEEAVECFKRALEVCPSCAMGHWGVSVCHGPNYNTASMTRNAFPSATDAYNFAVRAQELVDTPTVGDALSPLEKTLIRVLQVRFNAVPEEDDGQPINQNTVEYEQALQAVWDQYQEVPCVGCMYSEALMNHSPWKLWDLNSGEPKPYAVTARGVLETSLVRAPQHPGLLHFYIHLMEMSPWPHLALERSRTLQSLVKHAGHLIHMPSHIYVLCGQWQDAVISNVEAQAVDDLYVPYAGIHNSYTGYRMHNMHFIAYAAMFAGQFGVAMKAAEAIQRTLPPSLAADPVLAKYFESFYSLNVHVLIRFGKWREILEMEVPSDTRVWPYRVATTRYGRGIAFAVLGDVAAARAEFVLLKGDRERVPEENVLHNNTCRSLLLIALAMLEGEIFYREKSYEEAFRLLTHAVALSDALVYDEPWGWMQPPRHALGALMLEQGRAAEAALVFREDMNKDKYGRCHPDNIWALKGLQRCLVAQLKELPEGVAEATAMQAECSEIQKKIDTLTSSKDYDGDVTVACMCATKCASAK